ncbi:MAG: hypothetical protein WA948_05115 [Pontixanthobacter sp.]
MRPESTMVFILSSKILGDGRASAAIASSRVGFGEEGEWLDREAPGL